MVAVARSIETPEVLDRQRIVTADPQMAGSKQPYHAAAGLPFAHAEDFVRRAAESSRTLARAAIAAAVSALATRGYEVAGCAVLLGSGKALPALAAILAAHPLIHTAEGVFFRDVLMSAARECGLPATGVREKALDAALLKRLDALGKSLGPPWTQDQKYAAAAAFMTLCA
jgi:hypothetical protein